MNKEKQKRQIRMFLDGKGGKDVDAFCIYQWIERCHFHSWWDYALRLAPSVPPNSLDQHYHKRLDFLVSECRKSLEQFNRECVQIRNSSGQPQFSVPVPFMEACLFDLELQTCGVTSKGFALEADGRRVIFVEEITPKNCIFRLFDIDAEELSSWLRSHGFEHLVNGVVRPKREGSQQTAQMRITWPDATNLIDSLVSHLKDIRPVVRPAVARTAPIRASSYPASGKMIQFRVTATHTLRSYSVITFPPEHRRFFPGYKIPFILQTDMGDIETQVASGTSRSEIGDPDEGKYFSKNLKPWVRGHLNEIEEGGLVTIESVEPGQIYRLSVKR
ncbi:MAG: hypothetical protein H8D55_02590 [Deltaproteobacteria bacterium]|nr:hypothetical protein [Deltaproteobacteria bacterium]